MAVKADVREELDRLAGHVDSARGLLTGEGPVGRRLDFLTQEFMREANTLCSKSALSALTAVPQRIGRGGALTLNDVFWTNFKDDSTFFTTAKGNKSSGGATALGTTASLNAALTLYRKLKDRDGNPMATQPRVLLVPVDLEIKAAELMNSIQIVSGNTSGVPSTNVFAGRYEVVSSTYLTDTADFYLLASPADLPVMEVAFLNGVQSPIVETAEADFNTLGVQMRGYFDFGVSKGEDLAGVKMDV